MPTISKPFTFSAGAVIIASQHNSDFDTVYNLVNGTLDGTNLASNAAIADTQLNAITTAGKVSGAAMTSLSSIPSGAGSVPMVNLIPNSNYFIEGYATGRNVLRQFYVSVVAGGTPGTNITFSPATDAANAFNMGSLTTGTNVAKNSSGGSFALSTDGQTVTITAAETVVGILHYSFQRHVVKNASTTAGDIFFIDISVVTGKISLKFRRTGSNSTLDLTTILTTAGDELGIHITYLSST